MRWCDGAHHPEQTVVFTEDHLTRRAEAREYGASRRGLGLEPSPLGTYCDSDGPPDGMRLQRLSHQVIHRSRVESRGASFVDSGGANRTYPVESGGTN